MFTTELQYVVVRYMLNELADEAANVGIVAVTEDPPRIISRFLPDPSIKSRNDVRVKKESVDRFASFISSLKHTFEKSPSADASYSKAVFERLREFGAGLIRTNFPRSVLTNDLQREIDLLFNELVSPIGTLASRRSYAPRDPFSALRKEATKALVRVFRESYGGPLSRKTFRRQYEVKGATHKNIIDLAVVRGTKKHLHEHLFQHLLHLTDAEESFTQAAALCWRWSDIRETNHAERELTAVLYGRGGQPTQGLTEATRLLRREEIEVITLNELPGIVERLKGQPQLF